MKGHVTIELKDVNTGEVQRIEGKNIATNALNELARLLPIINDGNPITTIKNSFLPIAEKALGGLLLFADPIDAVSTNINIPPDKRILGMCADDADLTNANRGSYNKIESGKTERGYKSVWDFSTSQCNGTISCLCRTYVNTGGNLSTKFVDAAQHEIGFTCSDGATYPLLYENDYLYYVVFSGTTASIKKRYEPSTLKVANTPFSVGAEEDVLSYTASASISTSVARLCNGLDGYAYQGISISGTTFKYLKINLTTFEITEHTLTLPATPVNAGAGRICFSKGYLYFIEADGRTLYIYDLSTDTYISTEVTYQSSTTYCALELSPSGLVTRILTESSSNSSPYEIFYPDGTVIKCKSTYTYARGTNYLINKNPNDTLLARNAYSQTLTYFLNTKYLGTIFNLPSPITKTDAQAMKITYELIDA